MHIRKSWGQVNCAFLWRHTRYPETQCSYYTVKQAGGFIISPEESGNKAQFHKVSVGNSLRLQTSKKKLWVILSAHCEHLYTDNGKLLHSSKPIPEKGLYSQALLFLT